MLYEKFQVIKNNSLKSTPILQEFSIFSLKSESTLSSVAFSRYLPFPYYQLKPGSNFNQISVKNGSFVHLQLRLNLRFGFSLKPKKRVERYKIGTFFL